MQPQTRNAPTIAQKILIFPVWTAAIRPRNQSHPPIAAKKNNDTQKANAIPSFSADQGDGKRLPGI